MIRVDFYDPSLPQNLSVKVMVISLRFFFFSFQFFFPVKINLGGRPVKPSPFWSWLADDSKKERKWRTNIKSHDRKALNCHLEGVYAAVIPVRNVKSTTSVVSVSSIARSIERGLQNITVQVQTQPCYVTKFVHWDRCWKIETISCECCD